MAALLKSLYSKHPVLGNIVIYGSLYSAGDITQHMIMGQPQDIANTKRVGCVGGFLFGPIYTYWYRFLDGRLPGASAKLIVKKVVADQAVMGPVGVSIFYTGNFWNILSNNIYKSIKSIS